MIRTALYTARYAQLRTYRRNGDPVDTPIWFHLDGDTLVFRTKVGPKTRRIAADPRVEIWPCDYRGRFPANPVTVTGQASILSGESAEDANRALHRRYGWQYNLMPLIKVPGVTSADDGLPLRVKAQRLRMRTVWPDSAIVEVKLDFAGALGVNE
jgi:PPOX class probable F420-dependent enzyme